MKPKQRNQKSFKKLPIKQKLIYYSDYLKNIQNFHINFQQTKQNPILFSQHKQQFSQKQKAKKSHNKLSQNVQLTKQVKKNNISTQFPLQPKELPFSIKNTLINNRLQQVQEDNQTNFINLFCQEENIQINFCQSNYKKQNRKRMPFQFQTNYQRTSKITDLIMPSIQQRVNSQENDQNEKIIYSHRKYNSLNVRSKNINQNQQTKSTNKNTSQKKYIDSIKNRKYLSQKGEKHQNKSINTTPFSLQSEMFMQQKQKGQIKNKNAKISINVLQIVNQLRNQKTVSKIRKNSPEKINFFIRAKSQLS